MKNQTNGLPDSNTGIIYRAGGVSAIILVILYLIIIALYAYSGSPPSGGEEWLKYLAKHTTAWWAILGLSVLTDLLFMPVAFSLYHALKETNRIAVFAGAGFLILFVILDLAITWPNYATLITLSNKYAVTVDVSTRASIVAAANYASAVLSSTLLAFYIILVPAIGILMIGFVVLKGNFQ